MEVLGPLIPDDSPRVCRAWRRIRGITVLLIALLLITVLSPVLLVLAAAVDLALWLHRRKPWMAVRLLAMLWWFLAGELYGLLGLLVIWVLSGGRDSARRRDRVYRLKRRWLRSHLAGIRTLFGLRFAVSGIKEAAPGPVLVMILTKTEAAAKSAEKEVESGKSFARVAKSKSIDPVSRKKGGLLPEVVKGEKEESVDLIFSANDAAVFAAKVSTLSGPVKTSFGYYIFKILSSKLGSQHTLVQAQAAIKAQLTSTGQQTVFSKFVKEFKKKWKAKTDCRVGYVVEDCRQYKPTGK
jgi:PPIC-type PPIASE domain